MSQDIVRQDLGDPLAAIDALAREGAVGDAVGLAIVQALARRAEAQDGEARQVMLRRVEERIAGMTMRASAAPSTANVDEGPHRSAGLAGLSQLVDRLGRPEWAISSRALARSDAGRQPAAPMAVPPRPLKAAVEFQDTWSRLRVEQRLREALAQVPAAAGPLNTSRLVNHALQAMHELSPQYLGAFMSHVDALLWLEQASGGGDLAARSAPVGAAKTRSGGRAGRKA